MWIVKVILNEGNEEKIMLCDNDKPGKMTRNASGSRQEEHTCLS